MERTCIAFGICFIFAGLAFAFGKVHEHLAGWQQASEEERMSVQIGALCRNIGALIALSGVIFIGAGVNEGFHNNCFIWCMIGWFVLCGWTVWQVEKKGMYRI